MHEPRLLDDETVIGIILGHADTEAYLNRPKKDKRREPQNHKVPQKTRPDCLPKASFPAISLPEATKMKREMLRGPCLKACLVLSVFFSIAGIALVVVGTVMLTRPSSSSGGNHQWMLILGLLIVFVAIASYLCLRNYCAYHFGDAPVKVLSIEGEEMKGHQYQLVKKTEESPEKECTNLGETDQPPKECPEIKVVLDGEEDEILTTSGDILSDRKETVTFEDEQQIQPTSLHAPFDADIKSQLDVEFQRKLRRMSNIEFTREDRRMSDVEFKRNLRRKSDIEIQRELRRMSKVSQV